ncbi:single hybrid motif-containing protein [Trametes sanguinea]|nr:single hybrid motif-containing protein [Trametes sanguinea]
MHTLHHVSKAALRASSSRRWMQTSATRNAISKFAMPAMSPTMTEGGIASWKKKEGESFEAGDVLLEIETDKATIDVEAQEDGIVGKILAPDGTKNVPTDKTTGAQGEKKAAEAPLDGAAIRRMIVGNMLDASIKARAAAVPKVEADFDSIIADYLPSAKAAPTTPAPTASSKPKSGSDFIDGLI